MRARLARLIDFERLNAGDLRVSVAMTDIESGDLVLVDTGKGERIELDHLLATCGFLPEFAPVEVAGRLLGDGGLAANAPIAAVMAHDSSGQDLVCFVIDLYALDGSRPVDLESALARKSDLIFGNQTWLQLAAWQREGALRALITRLGESMSDALRAQPAVTQLLEAGSRGQVTLLHLSYRAGPEEAGPEKAFDMSPATLAHRWQLGTLDMLEALRVLDAEDKPVAGVTLHAIRRGDLPGAP
jgi:NTE family protein